MSFLEWANARRASLEAFIGERYLDTWPAMFGQAMRYPVFGGGKRFRPLLAMASFESIRGHNAPLDPLDARLPRTRTAACARGRRPRTTTSPAK